MLSWEHTVLARFHSCSNKHRHTHTHTPSVVPPPLHLFKASQRMTTPSLAFGRRSAFRQQKSQSCHSNSTTLKFCWGCVLLALGQQVSGFWTCTMVKLQLQVLLWISVLIWQASLYRTFTYIHLADTLSKEADKWGILPASRIFIDCSSQLFC